MTVAERMRRRGWSLDQRGTYWVKYVAGIECMIGTARRDCWLYTSWDRLLHPVVVPSDNPFDYTAVAPYGFVDVAQRCAAAARKLAQGFAAGSGE